MLYLTHFGLREAPFSITPDAGYFFRHDGAQAALNTLLVALRSGEGFLKIVGEVGCGKTVLCRQLMACLQAECAIVYIPNPDLGPKDLMHALALELGLVLPASASRYRLLAAIQQCLLAHAANGRAVVVCIDEAQAMPLRTMESLRLLSNLETDKRKLLLLVLFGQPELDVKLARVEVRQLLQRISFCEYLGPMALQDVPRYLRHRMGIAAGDGVETVAVFDSDAAGAIARLSGGVPRLINMLAHKCLMLAYGENLQQVRLAHVQIAANDTVGAQPASVWWRRLLGRAGARVAEPADARLAHGDTTKSRSKARSS